MRSSSRFRSAVLCSALVALCVDPLVSYAQDDSRFTTDEKVVNIGNVGLSISTRGYVGRMFGVRSGANYPPSFEYPLGSGIEHLWMAGLWVGARNSLDPSDVMVSAAIVDQALQAGATEPNGLEFKANSVTVTDENGEAQSRDDPLSALLISRNPLQQNFRLDALADEHFILRYSDENASGVDVGTFPETDPRAGQPRNPHVPMGLDVRCDVLAFSSRFADSFVILLFEVEHVGEKFLEDVYLGWYVEPLVIDRFAYEGQDISGGDLFFGEVQGYLSPEPNAREAASEHFSRELMLADPDARLIYRFNGGGDRSDATSWSGVRFLGSDAPEGFDVNYRQWVYSGGVGGIPNENDYADLARYAYMSGCDPRQPREQLIAALADGCRNQVTDAGRPEDPTGLDYTGERNWVGMVSVGPWPSMNPGDKVRFAIAMVAGENADQLLANSAVAQFNYDNGFAVPPGPPSPRLRAIPRNNAVELRWEPGVPTPPDSTYNPVTASPEYHRSILTNEFDFQGYRIYRIDAEKPSRDPFEEAKVLAEFDIATTVEGERDPQGFNTGLPPLDDGERLFIDRNVVNGYPYLYAVTSYSNSDPRREIFEIESGFNENSLVVVPGSGPDGMADRGEERPPISVYPNPYRGGSLYDSRFEDTSEPRELGRRIYFANVPSNANIDVYNIAGTRIVRLQNRGASSSIVEWDMLSEQVRTIAPGLYVWAAEDLDTGDVQRGKLVILK